MRVVARPGHELYVCEPDPGDSLGRRLARAELDAVVAALGASERSGGG
jgi:hypothetical protein